MSASTSIDNPVDATQDLLSGSNPSVWPNDTSPEAYHYYDHAQGERGPPADSPPYLYVWSPTDGDIQQFDAENSRQLEYRNVEVQVWSLDAQEVARYHRNLIQFLSEYVRDNYSNTEFHSMKPTAVSDLRSETPARQTDHYVMGVELETEDLQSTGVV